MNLKVNFANLVRQLLPEHKRQPVRLLLLRVLTVPLVRLFLSFESWRREIRIQINMTGQIGAMQGYLRSKYNNTSIRIDSYMSGGLGIGLEEEGVAHVVRIGFEPSADGTDSPMLLSLYGEQNQTFGDVSFVVYVPVTFDERTIEAIKIDVERYKQVLVKYKIIQQ